MRSKATCHPDRRLAARGLCLACYDKERGANSTSTWALRRRQSQLKFKFGITAEQYDKMFEKQGGACFICEKPAKAGRRRLSVDHDHQTGRVRGLLCWWCNNRIVTSRVTSSQLRRAANYLESDFDGRDT